MNMIRDKRGAAKGLLIFLAIIIVIGILLYSFNYNPLSNISVEDKGVKTVQDILNEQFSVSSEGAGKRLISVVGGILSLVIGDVPNNMISEGSKGMSALIVIICMWLMMILIFGDIFRNFSSLSDNISWIIGLLLAIAAANLQMLQKFAATATALFAGLGALASFAGLFASFIAFFVAEWGLEAFKPWLERRVEMIKSGNVREAKFLIRQGIDTLASTGRAAIEEGRNNSS